MAKDIPQARSRRWHRLFGLLLTDFLRGSPFTVELEKDLSHRQHLLDVVVVRREKGELTRRMPDGFDNLADHNLVTFKSFREPLNDWTLKELTGHYVNYRKQVSPRHGELLPENDFQLFGICARRPLELFRVLNPSEIGAGIYDVKRGTDLIRIIVASELATKEENSLLHLFSAASDRVKYGAEHYSFQSHDLSSIINDIFGEYRQEGLTMPYTVEDYLREKARDAIRDMSTEELREIAKRLPAKARLEGLSPNDRLEGLSEEEIASLEALLKSRRSSKPESKDKKRRRGSGK